VHSLDHQPLKDLPWISVIMPVRNEANSIADCLEMVLRQDYPSERMEVLIADGMSTDGTRQIVAELARKDARVQCIDNPDGFVSAGLNGAIRAAQGDVIIRLDAHTGYAQDYLRQCVAVLNETGADNVGGPWIARGQRYVSRAIAAAFQSPFCAGGARCHAPGHEGWVDTVYLGCWPRNIFSRIGLFDEGLVRNQDDEFNLRLTRLGGRIWQSPRIRCWYQPRESLGGLLHQYMQYGYWKVRVIQKHKLPASVRHVVPGLFIVLLLTLACLSPFSTIAAWTLAGLTGFYGLCLVAASLVTAWQTEAAFLAILPAVFWCYHFGYGYGFLRGLWDFVVWKNKPPLSFTSLTRVSPSSETKDGTVAHV